MRPVDEPTAAGPPPFPDREVGALRAHLVVLIIGTGILVSAALMTPSSDSLKVGPLTLPSFCLLRNTTGIPCPGCGLTRSVVHAVRGDWKGSFQYHRMGPIIVGFIVLQMLCRLAWMLLARFRAQINRVGRLLDWALIPLMVLLMINWIPTFVTTLRRIF